MLDPKLLLVLTVLHHAPTSTWAVHDVHMYVDPKGSDTNDGLSTRSPVKTLYQAVTYLQSKYVNQTYMNISFLHGTDVGSGEDNNTDSNNNYVHAGANILQFQTDSDNRNILPAYIELMPGYYDLDRTLYISRSNLTIRSYRRQEAHVTGGRRIPSTFIKQVTDKAILSRLPAHARTHVRVVNLHDLNITNFGKMDKYGSGYRRSSPLEVFYNAQPLHLARWPNEGYLDMIDFPDGKSGLKFRYNSTVQKSWHDENDPWTYGYWYAGWTDGAVKVSSMDATTKTVTLAEKPPHGFRAKGQWQDFMQGKPGGDGGYFRFINILSELDQPGEYYMDRDSGMLYMWFPNRDGNVKSSDIVYISMVDNCILLRPSAHNVRFEDFTIEACRRTAVYATNVQKLKMYKMEIKNTGNQGMVFNGDSRNFQISQCYVHDTCGGMYISGGNRKTLESSGNIIQNSEFVRYSRVGAVSNQAIAVSGDGFLVKNNHVYHGQTDAISFQGNDILIQNNLVHHVCENSTNCNAVHTYHDVSYRGNVIQNNIVHHILRLVPGGGNKAVYLDNHISGTRIISNVFYNNDVHVYIGGGRYNEIINNIMYNATFDSIGADTRDSTSPSLSSMLYERLHAMPYNGSVWSLRYPHLAEIDKHNATTPEGNQITKNIVYAAPNTHYFSPRGLPNFISANLSAYFNMTHTGFSAGSMDHYDVDKGDFRVTCKANDWANKVNFRQVQGPNSAGPLYSPVGPTYLNRGRVHLVNTTRPKTCATLAPPKELPVTAVIPDGSPGNHVYHVQRTGCWLNVTKCKNHTGSVGTYRDMYGERYRNAADNETMCFRRALEHWKFCGAHSNEPVVAIYGPRGTATLGGEGCYAAWYGCPNHGGPADGHLNTTNGKYFHDGAHMAPGEEGCLRRSADIWRWCGSSSNYPVTSIYLPTGAKRTAGGGCWITLERCPAKRHVHRIFYDISGATYYQTDDNEFACLHRAEYYWHDCGSNTKYPVTATYRPTTKSLTFP